MRKQLSRGFTIVELLVVIIVIAILASVTLVVYSGSQARARDADRYNDAKAIIEALTIYRSNTGSYPSAATMGLSDGDLPVGCSLPTGYSYSIATDTSWLQELMGKGYLDKKLTPPTNDCSHYYSYIHSTSPTQYGCTYGVGFYILQVQGAEGSITPAQALTSAPASCSSWPASLISNSTSWTFIGFDDGTNR